VTNFSQRSLRKLSLSQSRPRAQTERKSLWDLLNSGFVLFLMSSVVLGLFSFGYSQWRDYRNRQQKSDQLNLEIALRLQAADKMCSGGENKRYSNLVNVNQVIDGDPKSSFYVRKPLFNEFQNKSLTTLLWQLYLLVPASERDGIKRAITDVNSVVDEIRQARYEAVNDFDDDKPVKPRTKKQQDEQDDKDDILKKDYGQADIYRRVHSLAQRDQWRNLVF
jgi:hypothetical protein